MYTQYNQFLPLPCTQLVGQSLLWTLEKGLGDIFTAEVKDAWTTMYGLVATEMKEGLEEYNELSDDV